NQVRLFIDRFLANALPCKEVSHNGISHVYRGVIAKKTAGGSHMIIQWPKARMVLVKRQVVFKCFKLRLCPLVLFQCLLHKRTLALTIPALDFGIHIYPFLERHYTAFYKTCKLCLQ